MTDVARREPGPYTWDDFIALDEDDLRELIDGELVEVEVPTTRTSGIVPLLGFYLGAGRDTHGGGATFGSGYKVRITNKRGVMPDLQFYRAGQHAARPAAGARRGSPGPGRRDRVSEQCPLRPRREDELVRVDRRRRSTGLSIRRRARRLWAAIEELRLERDD